MRVLDAHRVIGPLPHDHVRSIDVPGVVAELDHLDIQAAAVTPSAALFGDPRGAGSRGPAGGDGRLLDVAVALPGTSGTSAPTDVAMLVEAAPVMVRTCPVRHRFDLLGTTALHWWRVLAESGIAVALDVSEVGLEPVAGLARQVPGLRVLALSPGYRLLRQLDELLRDCPEVRIETGTVVGAGAIEWLARSHGAHRLVFGTGAPLWDDAGPRFQLDHLDLPDDDVALIAGGSLDLLTHGRRR